MSCLSDFLEGGHSLLVTVNQTVKKITESGIQFDAIAFCGVSGSLIAPSVSIILSKPLLLVRKPNISSHSVSYLEGHGRKPTTSYIIIDDFIASGGTIYYITEIIAEKIEAACVGIFLYNHIDLSLYPIRETSINVPVFSIWKDGAEMEAALNSNKVCQST